MPVFAYQALDAQGKKRSGMLDAHSISEAKIKLREQGMMISRLEQKSGGTSKETLRGESLLTFTLQLSQLVGAGVPIYESLIALEEQYREESSGRIILSLCDRIKSGGRLSEAMADFPDSFNKLYCSMIKAGESAGALDIVLDKLAILLAKQHKLKRDLMTAMIYPGILAGFCCILIVILLGFVVPMIEGIFEGRQLNAFTEFVMGTSRLFRAWWWVFFPLVVVFLVWVYFQLKKEKGKRWLEKVIMRTPVVKKLMIQAAVARFSRTMGTLQKGGLTMIDSLRIAREVMQNWTLEEEMKQAEGRIVEGSSLSYELAKSKWVPKIVSRMLAVGEESGTTVAMFNKIADIYEENLEKALDQVMALAQPVILIVMGGIIGTVLLAILLPLADMSSFKV